MTAKRRLTDIVFNHEGAHVALVGKHQGGAANGYTTLVTKATDHLNEEQVKAALEDITEQQPFLKEPIVDTIEKSVHLVLLEKAVEDAVKVEKAAHEAVVVELQKSLDDQAAVLKAAEDKLAEFAVAAQEAVAKSRKDAITEAGVPTDKVEALYKAYAQMDDEGFTVAVEVLKAQQALANTSEMLGETGVTGVGEPDKTKEDKVAEILKAKYQPKSLEIK